MKWYGFILITILIFFLAGCITAEDDPTSFVSAPLRGMVYDEKGQGVFGVSIRLIDNEEKEFVAVESDIHGRFTMPDVKRGTYHVELEKAGFEKIQKDLAFVNRTQIFYARMISWRGLLDVAVMEMENGQYEQAHQLINRAESAGGRPQLVGMLRATVHFLQRDYG
ncbi:MAG: carboxypeptidase regulatory-like domain-containing protein, partial [Spirochaetaceae bacterium]